MLEILKVRLADTDTIGNIDAVVGSMVNDAVVD